MNVNEVISNLVSHREGKPLGSHEPVHPNDHVNRSQSTNDAFPAAIHIATAAGIKHRLLPEVQHLTEAFAEKSEAWQEIVKIGRTHLQDAVPLTLGQEASAWCDQLASARIRIETSLQELHPLPLGGTAVGTGLNAPKGFAEEAAAELVRLTVALVLSPQQIRCDGEPRRARQCHGPNAIARSEPAQDCERYPPARMRPPRRPGRTSFARKRTRQLDHAWEGESNTV